MDESTKNSPCKECDVGVSGPQLHAEVEHLRQHLAERDAHIVALEGEFIKCTTRSSELEEQLGTWTEKYERLYDSHKRVQKLNQILEEKLLQMVDKMKGEKSQLTKDIATLSVRLAESKHNYSMLQKENERYKNDMNLAIQLLQCKPDNFVAQKLDNLSVDTQARVSQYVMSKTTKPSSSSAQSKTGNDGDTFDAMSCNSSAQALLACEAKLCGCSRKDDNCSNESKKSEGQAASSKEQDWRRRCGCIRTSEKLRQLLKSFPTPPPPSPASLVIAKPEKTHDTCIAAFCAHAHNCHFPVAPALPLQDIKGNEKTIVKVETEDIKKAPSSSIKCWQVVSELVQLVQLSVTATALALYYLIYCYMQLVYYTLRSALYFHNADGPMKITIGVVTLTSLVVGFNLVVRVEKLFGIFY